MRPKIAMQRSASLKVEERSVLTRSTEAEPNATDGMNQGISLFAVDFASKASDVDVDYVRGWIKMQVPDVLQHIERGTILP